MPAAHQPEAVMVLPGALSICCLGRIKFLNPKWHTKDLIYPLGYHVCPKALSL